MILLDTNVISEAMRPQPAPEVSFWLNAQTAETLFVSSVTLAELLFGIGTLPTGARKDRLAQALDALLQSFHGRVLPFDHAATKYYTERLAAHFLDVTSSADACCLASFLSNVNSGSFPDMWASSAR